MLKFMSVELVKVRKYFTSISINTSYQKLNTVKILFMDFTIKEN